MRQQVAHYLRSIEKNGDNALGRLSRRFDQSSLKPSQWKVAPARIKGALRKINPGIRSILKEAARNIEVFHKAERRAFRLTWSITHGGMSVGQRWAAVETAGLYVPGGRFAYPSTVLMTAIPARVAGVKKIIMATPPKHLTDEVLAAAALAGVDEIYQLGGVAAIGAMAYGTPTVPKVDFIAGPGGAWVTEAKRQVYGTVGIDSLAGPSEIAVVVDGSSPLAYAAADMMAQAEHDPSARAVALGINRSVLKTLKGQIDLRWVKQCQFIHCRDWVKVMDKVNLLAPEHLSLMVKNPKALLSRVRHAGAIFLGGSSPVAAGDYWAGPSHTLPTAGAARFSSGLSVQTFMKRSSVISISSNTMAGQASSVARLALAEGLERHAQSLFIRKKGPSIS